MTLNRRSLIKSLIASTILPSISLESFAKDCTDGYVSIRFIGLFFFEFQNGYLIAATPKYSHHYFKVIYNGGAPTDMPEYVVPNNLETGSRSNFNPGNLQFRASLLSDGNILDYQHPYQKHHRCTMILPPPENICLKNFAPASMFHPKESSQVGKDILAVATSSSTNSQLAASTILLYKPKKDVKPYSVIYYAAHRHPTVHGVNCALRAARHMCGSKFDLQMKDIPKHAWANNEKTLDAALKEHISDEQHLIDIASCPQFVLGH